MLFMDDTLYEENVSKNFDELEVQNSHLWISFSWRRLFLKILWSMSGWRVSRLRFCHGQLRMRTVTKQTNSYSSSFSLSVRNLSTINWLDTTMSYFRSPLTMLSYFRSPPTQHHIFFPNLKLHLLFVEIIWILNLFDRSIGEYLTSLQSKRGVETLRCVLWSNYQPTCNHLLGATLCGALRFKELHGSLKKMYEEPCGKEVTKVNS